MHAVLEEFAQENNSWISIGQLDVAHNYDVAVECSIMGTPTLILFTHGKPVWRHTGLIDKHRLKSQLQNAISPA